MELNWSLKELYPSFESKEFKEDLNSIDDLINKINKFVGEISSQGSNARAILENYIELNKKLEALIIKVSNFCELTFSVDTKNSLATKNIEILEEKISNTTKAATVFEKYIGTVEDLDEVINSSEFLKVHKFYLKEIKEKSNYLLSEEEEVVIAKMRNTGSSAWGKLKDALTAALMVEVGEGKDKKEVPLTVARNLAYDKDAKVRKNAYEGELKAYEKIADSVAASLNAIKGEVITVGKLRGYKSPLQETLLNSRMDEEVLNAMLEAMKESLPSFVKYFRRKAELLGHQNGLPFYDLFAPMGEANMEYSYEEAQKFIVKNFGTFSPKLAAFAKKAFDKHWVDVLPKEGKVGGAFCSNIHPIGESRIMTNFGGTFSDVVTLAHELGHGYHGDCLMEEELLNSDYPMPIAETASTFCETIVKKAAIKEASKEEAFAILEQEVSDCAQVIVDILSRFLFESEVFAKRQNSSLTTEELKEIMIKAQKEAYGEGLDPEYLHPYMWVCKSHYYSAHLSFYNFPYAFGLLFAKGLFAEYQRRGEDFVKDYDMLLKNTGKLKIADITRLVNIDITNKEFWKNSLKTIEEDIEKFIELSK